MKKLLLFALSLASLSTWEAQGLRVTQAQKDEVFREGNLHALEQTKNLLGLKKFKNKLQSIGAEIYAQMVQLAIDRVQAQLAAQAGRRAAARPAVAAAAPVGPPPVPAAPPAGPVVVPPAAPPAVPAGHDSAWAQADDFWKAEEETDLELKKEKELKEEMTLSDIDESLKKAYEEAGEPDHLTSDFKNAIKDILKQSTEEVVNRHLADVEKAIGEFEEIVKEHPEDTEARTKLNLIESVIEFIKEERKRN